MNKFGYPETLIKEYTRWVLLLRPQQVTLGSLVLACRDEATAFSQITPEAFSELQPIIREVERSLSRTFSYEKINYLMLMMVDLDVHFHILPRYGTQKVFGEQVFVDHGWPGLPDLKTPNMTSKEIIQEIKNFLKSNWVNL